MIAATGFHTSDLVLLVVIVVLLCGSGFLALAETGLVRTSKVRAHSLREGGVKGSSASSSSSTTPRRSSTRSS